MAAIEVIRTAQLVQYTGSNSAEILSYTGGAIQSETSGVLRIRDSTSAVMLYLFSTGDYWDITAGNIVKAADFAANYVTRVAALADTTGMTDGVSVSLPLLALGAVIERVVTWNRPFPNANYNVVFLPDTNVIGRVTPSVKAGTKTATGLTVVLTAGLVVNASGAVLHVLGTT